MGATNKAILGEMAVELSQDTKILTGGWDLIGPLIDQPVIIIFDNQSDITVQIGNDGVNPWKTFQAGSAVLLDMRANHGIADNFLFRKGMNLYAMGTATAGNQFFKISYVFANPTLL